MGTKILFTVVVVDVVVVFLKRWQSLITTAVQFALKWKKWLATALLITMKVLIKKITTMKEIWILGLNYGIAFDDFTSPFTP